MNEQMDLFDIEPTDEQKAFNLLYPRLSDIIFDAPPESGILIFDEQSNYSSVYFLEVNELFFRIRIRKKSRYFTISEEFANTLPEGVVIVRPKSDEGKVRIIIHSYEDVLMYVETFRTILIHLCKRHRDVGCCSRYELCSDAGKCIHPDPKFALTCWYQQNLRDGKIFYGKNKNVI